MNLKKIATRVTQTNINYANLHINYIIPETEINSNKIKDKNKLNK